MRIHKIITLAVCGLAALMASAKEYPQLTDLPTLYIDTEGYQPVTSKNDYVAATVRWVDADGTTVYDDGNIRGRGNGTWIWDKKAYRIKFEKKKKFLGDDRANAKSWTLLANYADKTLIRNGVAAEVGTLCGQPFTAAAVFVDFVLNGEYLGNYQVSDQIDIRKKRVNIVEQELPADENSDITGGYLMEVDGYYYDNPYWFQTDRNVKIAIKSPDDDVINKAQVNYIRNHIQKFENALFSEEFRDPERGYRQYVDSLTLASWYIASEFTGNPDCFWSTYIYKDQGDDKIYWGPLWDFDIAFNNCIRIGDVTKLLMSDRAFAHDLTRLWVNRMWQDPWFVNLINREWKRILADDIDRKVVDYIEATAAHIDQSQALNFKKWPINRRDHDEIVLFDTYREGIDYLEAYIYAHTDYLTTRFACEAGELPWNPYEGEEFVYDKDYYYTITNQKADANVTHNIEGQLCIGAGPSASSSIPDDQLWDLVHICGNRYMLINVESGRAITDISTLHGNLYTGGAYLSTDMPDPRSERQLWAIHPEGSDGACYFKNVLTYLSWSNSGGKADPGNPIMSWNNEPGQMHTHLNRMFFLRPARLKPGVDGLATAEISEYSVTYSPAESLIRFNGPDIRGTWRIYTTAGVQLLNGDIAPEINVAQLPAGLHILTWTDATGRTRSTKFRK